jgi:hypothetical protein
MPGAESDSGTFVPLKFWPVVTSRRLVPSVLISVSRPAWLEDEMPRTATIAATPIAIPSAESAERNRRVRTPMLASRARSPGRSRAGVRLSAAAVMRRC